MNFRGTRNWLKKLTRNAVNYFIDIRPEVGKDSTNEW